MRVDVLGRDYPLDHEVIIYRGATLPIEQPRIRHLALKDLPAAPVRSDESVMLRPAPPLVANRAVRERLAEPDRASKAPGEAGPGAS